MMLNIPKTTRAIALLVVLFTAIFIWSCSKEEPVRLKIALSKGIPDTSYANYYNWIRSLDSTVVCLDMYGMSLDSALKLFSECSGLILTGGTDIDPGLYGRPADTSRCMPVDHKRDSLEIALLQAARQAGKPVLGICRGEQMINVACGGSLVVDIPSDFDTTVHHQCTDYLTCFHTVTVESNTFLNQITGVYAGEVTSNHHQGVDRLGSELRATSYSTDGLIEALEWSDPEGKPFMIAVQWHPERMAPDNPLSGQIALRFLNESNKYITSQRSKEN